MLESKFYQLTDSAASMRHVDTVLIHEFSGYVGAGRIAESIPEHLLEYPHDLVATFDVDEFLDYGSRRPWLALKNYEWTPVKLHKFELYRCFDEAQHPFFLLTGPEPDLRWNGLGSAILDLAEWLGVTCLVTGNGIHMPVPHTRPLVITAHGNRPEFVSGNSYVVDESVKMPGFFSTYLELLAGNRGVAAHGYVAHVPHYFGQNKYPQAVMDLLSRIAQSSNLQFTYNKLVDEAAEHLNRVDQETNEDPDVLNVIRALEESYDEMAKHSVPSIEEISEALTQFLAEQDKS